MVSRMPSLSMQPHTDPASAALAGSVDLALAGGGGRQETGAAVTGCPAALMAPLEMIQAPGCPGTSEAVMAGGEIDCTDSSVVIVCTGGMRCGRTQSGMATWTTAKMARVMAMA